MMRIKGLVLAAAAAIAAAGAPDFAVAGWWPFYSYYGYDPAFGLYGSPAAGPAYRYVPPRTVYAEPVCTWRRVWAVGRWQRACF
jgi:hypothetical protein